MLLTYSLLQQEAGKSRPQARIQAGSRCLAFKKSRFLQTLFLAAAAVARVEARSVRLGPLPSVPRAAGAGAPCRQGTNSTQSRCKFWSPLLGGVPGLTRRQRRPGDSPSEPARQGRLGAPWSSAPFTPAPARASRNRHVKSELMPRLQPKRTGSDGSVQSTARGGPARPGTNVSRAAAEARGREADGCQSRTRRHRLSVCLSERDPT